MSDRPPRRRIDWYGVAGLVVVIAQWVITIWLLKQLL